MKMNHNWKLFLETIDVMSCRLNSRGTIQLLISSYQTVQKPASLMVWGCISVSGEGRLHIWKGIINAEEYKEVLEQHLLPSRCLLWKGLAYFSKTMLNHTLHPSQQHEKSLVAELA